MMRTRSGLRIGAITLLASSLVVVSTIAFHVAGTPDRSLAELRNILARHDAAINSTPFSCEYEVARRVFDPRTGDESVFFHREEFANLPVSRGEAPGRPWRYWRFVGGEAGRSENAPATRTLTFDGVRSIHYEEYRTGAPRLSAHSGAMDSVPTVQVKAELNRYSWAEYADARSARMSRKEGLVLVRLYDRRLGGKCVRTLELDPSRDSLPVRMRYFHDGNEDDPSWEAVVEEWRKIADGASIPAFVVAREFAGGGRVETIRESRLLDVRVGGDAAPPRLFDPTFEPGTAYKDHRYEIEYQTNAKGKIVEIDDPEDPMLARKARAYHSRVSNESPWKEYIPKFLRR